MNLVLSRFSALADLAAIRSFRRGEVLYAPGDEVERVYFPTSGLLSFFMMTKGGKLLEVGSVGRDGLFGGMVAFGMRDPNVRVVAAANMSAAIVQAEAFKRVAGGHIEILQACIVQNEALLSQARALSVCNTFHDILARYARYSAFWRSDFPGPVLHDPGKCRRCFGSAPDFDNGGCQQACRCWRHRLSTRVAGNSRSSETDGLRLRLLRRRIVHALHPRPRQDRRIESCSRVIEILSGPASIFCEAGRETSLDRCARARLLTGASPPTPANRIRSVVSVGGTRPQSGGE